MPMFCLFMTQLKNLHWKKEVSDCRLVLSMQDVRPVAYASQTLTNIKHIYKQIEKQMLCSDHEKIHHYTYGCQGSKQYLGGVGFFLSPHPNNIGPLAVR